MENECNKWLEYNDLIDGISRCNEMSKDYNPRITIDQNIMIASMGCVMEQDRVLLATKDNRELALILSFLYNPQYLMIVFQDYVEEKAEEDRVYWRRFLEKYNEYLTTTPYLLKKSINIARLRNAKYDVIIYSYYEDQTRLQEECHERFSMTLGDEYERFRELISNADRLLNDQGRLIVFVRACWILPVWELLEKNHLQFEYQWYRQYMQEEHHQNRFVWLRFTHVEEGFDVESQKRNLYQFMDDNNIDRLFAHRNDYCFPYNVYMTESPPAYVKVEQNRSSLQYFFSADTTEKLTELCVGYTACLVVPSVAMCAYDHGKDIVLFELDNRFRNNGDLKFVKYDLYKGLNVNSMKYKNKFSTVICDPPFNIDLDVLAKDIYELIQDDESSNVYIVYPRSRGASLCNSMKKRNMYESECQLDKVEYSKPPRLVRQEGADAIKLFKFNIVKE